jgi:hypothetical protein
VSSSLPSTAEVTVSLEDDLKNEMWQAIQRDPKFMEMHVTGGEVDFDWPDALAFINRRVEAVQEAVLRLAREIDGLRT